MPVITISRGSYSHGKEVAEKLAMRLGYQCISREIILNASEHFNIPEIVLIRAVHDAPSVLERFMYGREKYLAYVREALLYCLQKDNIIYHGLGGHFFVRGISHVLKVRIIADLKDRVEEEVRREGISAEGARKALMKDDDARRRWSHYIYGIDPLDPSLYDLAIHMKSMTVDETVETISRAVRLPCFQPTPESRNAMRMLFLAAQMQTSLMDEIPSVKVEVEGGEIVVTAKGYWAEGKKLLTRIDQIIDTEKEGVRITLRLTNR
jgi:hypothetical protein